MKAPQPELVPGWYICTAGAHRGRLVDAWLVWCGRVRYQAGKLIHVHPSCLAGVPACFLKARTGTRKAENFQRFHRPVDLAQLRGLALANAAHAQLLPQHKLEWGDQELAHAHRAFLAHHGL